MPVFPSLRRIFLTNQNVIHAINEETGLDEKIKASKIAGITSTSTGTVSPSVGYLRTNVQKAIGTEIIFDPAFGVAIDAEGDYQPIIEAKVGTLKVNTTYTKAPGSLLIKPDMDGARILVTILPLTAPA